MLALDNDIDTSNDCEALIQNLGIGIVKHDITGKTILSNNAALEMLGLTEDELHGKTSIDPSWNIIYENGSEFPSNKYPANIAIATEKPVNNVVMGVHRPITKDRIWLLVNAQPQFDNGGFLLNVLVTFTNITAYKKVQDELSIKNQILNSIGALSLDIIGVMTINGIYRYVSKAATIISGYTEAELLHINALDLAPKKTKEYIRQLLLSLPVVGKVENMLSKIICKDDTIKYISWSFQWDAKTELIYVNGRDKTDQVKQTRAAEAKRIADEQQTRHLIFEVEEQKRNSISYELHENVGQIVATAKVYIDRYEKTGSKLLLQECKKLLSICIEELRVITYTNSMPDFNNVGFTNAIEILMQLQFKKLDVVHALHMAIDDATIGDSNKINIYRLVQLWLGHIATRDGLASVLATITCNTDRLLLQITDEVTTPTNYTDYLSPDLMPIKERLNVIGGSMTLQPSDDNQCFTITFLLKK